MVEIPARVTIIAAPVACQDGVNDTWREVSAWAAKQLNNRFGEQVVLQYYDLFDPDCPPIPQDVRLPLVLVNDKLLSSGGKVSVPAIRKQLVGLGLTVII
jgi:hypothetical protein